MMQPKVSVVVPTFNSARTLDACLASIRAQTYQDFELIVVDKFSDDNTAEIAKRHGVRFFEHGPERCEQRNVGLQKAEGEFVMFIDSDMKLSEEVIADCMKIMDAWKEVVGIVIPEESFGEGFWAQCKKLERSFYVGIEWMEAARFFHTATVRSIGGYDESLVSGEDWDLSQRMGEQGGISRIPSYIFHDEGKPTLRGLVTKKWYYATKIADYTSKDGSAGSKKQQTSIFSRYALFFSRPRGLWKRPVLGLGMLFMKTSEFGAGGVSLLLGKLRRETKPIVIKDEEQGEQKKEVTRTESGKLPVSVVMVIYNNDDIIRRCLESVAVVADEIIFIHDGKCTDQSVEIAREYTDKVYVRQHIGCAEWHRVESYEMAKYDWVLQIDADEYLSDELTEALPVLLADEDVDIYDLSWPIQDKGKEYLGTHKNILFRKSQVKYIGALHEYVKPRHEFVVTKAIDEVLKHEPGYDNYTLKTFNTKWRAWADVHAKQLLLPFDQIPKFQYTDDDWDFPMRVRLKYPLVLGMVGSFVYHVLVGIVRACKRLQWVQLRAEVFYGMYYVVLFYRVITLRSKKRKGI